MRGDTMKKLLLLLLLSLAFIGSAYADKETTLVKECVAKIKKIDTDRQKLPYKIDEISYAPLHTISGTSITWGESGSYEKDNNYCNWFQFYSGDAIYGNSSGCAYGSLQAIKVFVLGKNRFNEKVEGVFVCAFRGGNYKLDGIRAESYGRYYTDEEKFARLLEALQALDGSSNKRSQNE